MAAGLKSALRGRTTPASSTFFLTGHLSADSTAMRIWPLSEHNRQRQNRSGQRRLQARTKHKAPALPCPTSD